MGHVSGKDHVEQCVASLRRKLMVAERLVPREALGERGPRLKRKGRRDSNGVVVSTAQPS